MTLEGYLVIAIAVLVLIKSMNMFSKEGFGLLMDRKMELGLLFVNTILVVLNSDLILGLAIANSLFWVVFYNLMKSIKFQRIALFNVGIFWVYLYATQLTFQNLPKTEVWYLTLLVMFVTLLMVLIYDVIGRFSHLLAASLVFVLGLGFVIPPAIFIMYSQAFGMKMNVAQLNAIYQSNIREAYEFMFMYASKMQLFIIPLLFFALIGLFFYRAKEFRGNLNSRWTARIAVFLFVLVNLSLLESLALPSMIMNTQKIYAQELEKFREELKKRKIGDVEFDAFKEKGKELYVVVIGESLNKNHMSLYGYHRNTTPKLDSLYNLGELVKCENAISNHTHTIPVLTQALTTANQLNGEAYFGSLSILDILEKADFDTYWLSNQVSYGEWDNPISVLADRADYRVNINSNIGTVTNTDFYDEKLVQKLDEIVDSELTKNTVVFIHVMGNHGAYENRYPEAYNLFSGSLATNAFGANKYWAKNVNAYDNSVVYSDKLLVDVFESVKKHDNISACLFFSDHSEDVLANKGHNASSFTFSMTQIPLLAWFSDAYKENYQKKYLNLLENNEELMTNDFMYDLLVDFFGISTSHMQSNKSLMSDMYDLDASECYSLHRKKSYTDPSNTFYHQKKNLSIIDSLGLMDKVYPHRVNTSGKLLDVIYSGCTSAEVDVLFMQNDTSSYFEIGHDMGALSGMSLETFLDLSKGKLTKLWLDIKNLNHNNYLELEQRLLHLDKLYNMKSKFIVETSSTTPLLSGLSDLGFHTSYYIPTSLMSATESQLLLEARKIAKQVELQNLSAVSFDSGLYPFVKKHIEPLISEDIVYHTWDISLKLKTPNFWENISGRGVLKDDRVKSILVKYHSPFEL